MTLKSSVGFARIVAAILAKLVYIVRRFMCAKYSRSSLLTKTIIHLTSNNDLKSFIRQTPAGDGIWDDYQFDFVNGRHDADWLIAFDEPHRECQTDLPKSRRILFRTEPQSIKFYSADFLNQFGTIVAIDASPSFHGTTILSQTALPWMYGLDFSNPGKALQWDALRTNRPHTAKGEISVVCSTKNMNINQSRRIRFLGLLKEALGERLTIYGRGFEQIADKKEAIDGFRYHLVLENNLLADGWTEKLADPILGGVFPISAGAPNLNDYFDPQGFASIDITKPKQAVIQVLNILEQDRAAVAGAAMAENRRRLMFEHNMFPLCCKIIEQLQQKQETSILRPGKMYSFYPNIKPAWKKLLAIPKPLRPKVRKLYLSLTETQ